MNMLQVVRARTVLGAINSGYNVPEEIQATLRAAHDALLAYERSRPMEQAAALDSLAGSRLDWEIA